MSTPTHVQRKPGPLNPANARWQARRRRMIGYGQWQPFMDAEPVRAHLRKVMEAGMSLAAVCERLGLPHTSSLQHLVYGRGTQGGPGQQIRRETAELILAYWPVLNDFPDGARIDPTGTVRRVQALGVRGWPRHWMATQLGFSETSFKKALNRERVTARIARGIVSLYDQYWNLDPLKCGLAAKAVDRVKADAVRAGWHGPLAWDDDTIDDPTALPQTDAPAPAATDGENLAARWLMGESVILSRAERREVLQYLFEWTTDTTAQIAARLDMSPEAAERQWHRLQQRAAADGRRLWRRAWAYRDKDLTKNEMGEAA